MSETKNLELRKPSKEQAKRSLREYNYEDRLIGARMHPMAGNKRKPLYSLEEIYKFLEIENPKKLIEKGTGTSINYIDPDSLMGWINDILKDKELSKKIKENIENKNNYMDKIRVIKELIDKRIYQSREILEKK